MKQIKVKNIITAVAVVLLFTACEEVIDIDLNSSDPVIAAEGLIEKDSVAWLKLSYSSDYYNPEESEKIENAIVTVSDSEGNTESLEHYGNGLYKGNNVLGKPDTEYTLDFAFDEQFNSASSGLKNPMEIYAVEFDENENPRPGEEDSYKVTLKLSNIPDVNEFSLAKFWVNNIENKDSYYLINDEYFAKGDTIEYNPFLLTFDKGDNVKVIVYSIDEDTYKYYSQLNDLLGGRMGATSTPYNPQSNFGNEVMGYFAAWSSTKQFAKVE